MAVPSAEEAAKNCKNRPYPRLVVDIIKRSWGYLLHGRMSLAEVINIIFHTAEIANNRRFDEQVAAQAAVRYYYYGALEQAWRESCRSGSDEQKLCWKSSRRR